MTADIMKARLLWSGTGIEVVVEDQEVVVEDQEVVVEADVVVEAEVVEDVVVVLSKQNQIGQFMYDLTSV
jgi:hypothetical protein